LVIQTPWLDERAHVFYVQNDPALTREASSVARSIDPKAIKGKEKEKEKEEDKASQGKGKKRKLDNNGSAKADEVSADDMTFPVNFVRHPFWGSGRELIP